MEHLNKAVQKAFAPFDTIVYSYLEPDGRVSQIIHVQQYNYNQFCPSLHKELNALSTKDWLQGKFRGRDVPRLIRWHQDEGFPYKYSGSWKEALPTTPVVARLQDQLQSDLSSRLLPVWRRSPLTKDMDMVIDLNSVLINKYRGATDSIMKHADSEPYFGANPTIVSMSCGETRMFHLEPMKDDRRKDMWKRRTDELTKLEQNVQKQIAKLKAKKQHGVHTCTRRAQWEVMSKLITETRQWLTKEYKRETKSLPGSISIPIQAGDLVIMAGATQDWWQHWVPPDTSGTRSRVRYNLTYRPFIIPAAARHAFRLDPSPWLHKTRQEIEQHLCR